jgi:hypothetical protein
VPVGTIKRHATGKGNASKAEVMRAMAALRHTPVDDNDADALAILHWALDQSAGLPIGTDRRSARKGQAMDGLDHQGGVR